MNSSGRIKQLLNLQESNVALICVSDKARAIDVMTYTVEYVGPDFFLYYTHTEESKSGREKLQGQDLDSCGRGLEKLKEQVSQVQKKLENNGFRVTYIRPDLG